MWNDRVFTEDGVSIPVTVLKFCQIELHKLKQMKMMAILRFRLPQVSVKQIAVNETSWRDILQKQVLNQEMAFGNF